MIYNFQTTYNKLNSKLFQEVSLPQISEPKTIVINQALIQKLGISYKKNQDPSVFLESSEEKFFAQAYAGHQFGHFSILGDGRAMMMGEHITSDNNRIDIQLKGGGRTQYSRGGDGLATMSSMLREYIYSYAMDALQIKTSKSLAVLSTNKKVLRNEVHDGAILVRAMESHIRFGTFEYVSKMCTQEELKEFTDYAIKRHYPELIGQDKKYVKFFQSVMNTVIDMVIDWYRVGFIHGVMNTDNMSITGNTFDYGPCAFLNSYDPLTVYSEIDTYGRYCFGNQKDILKWNLGVFGSAIISLFEEEGVSAKMFYESELENFDLHFENRFSEMMKRKLGIPKTVSAENIINKYIDFLEKNKPDYTNTFIELMYPGSFDENIYKSGEFLELRKELETIGLDLEIMKKSNPQFILRNHFVEEALDYYESFSSLEKVDELLEVVSCPYVRHEKWKKFQQAPSKEFERQYTTHCNT